MIKMLQCDGDWCGYTSDDCQFSVPNISELHEHIDGFSKTLKDDRRSLVKLGDLGDINIVAKQPRDKNDRKWSRFLSYFSPAEARRTFITLLEFKQKGIESLTPICFLEKKRWGMVVDSWILYEYREGRESDRSHLKDIVEQLTLLHSNGYRHEDPNFGNFLIDDNGQLFLIDCKGKSRSGRFSDYYDFMLLEARCHFEASEIEALIDIKRCSFGYLRANIYRMYIRTRTKCKEFLGRKRSKNQRH